MAALSLTRRGVALGDADSQPRRNKELAGR